MSALEERIECVRPPSTKPVREGAGEKETKPPTAARPTEMARPVGIARLALFPPLVAQSPEKEKEDDETTDGETTDGAAESEETKGEETKGEETKGEETKGGKTKDIETKDNETKDEKTKDEEDGETKAGKDECMQFASVKRQAEEAKDHPAKRQSLTEIEAVSVRTDPQAKKPEVIWIDDESDEGGNAEEVSANPSALATREIGPDGVEEAQPIVHSAVRRNHDDEDFEPDSTSTRPVRPVRPVQSTPTAGAGQPDSDEVLDARTPSTLMELMPPAPPPAPRNRTPTRQRAVIDHRMFEHVDWPYQVAHLAANYNRTNIRFSRVDDIGRCGCHAPCRVNTCPNAEVHLTCTPAICSHWGKCGNGVRDLEGLRIRRVEGTDGELKLITIKPIDSGVVVGQYLGELSMVRTDIPPEANEGYRMYFHRDGRHPRNERVCVNALHCGSMMRFVNHACDPNATFMEMASGSDRTVVVATTRRVLAGEEITVHYGDDLWFVCRCAVCRTSNA